MALRYLLYLRSVLFLILLLAVLYSPEPRIHRGLSIFLLVLFVVFHGGLAWSVKREKIPPDWSLYASLLDVVMIALMIYATSGIEVNLYIAYFVTIIGALMMESLVMGFLIAGVACTFYGLTVAFIPDAFTKPEHLLPFAMLIIASFYITFISDLIHDKRRAVEEKEKKQALWREHLAACRRLLADLRGIISKPMDRICEAAEGPLDKKKDDILWEVDGIRGQLKRMAAIFQEKVEHAPLEVGDAFERAIFKLGSDIQEAKCEIDVVSVAPALVDCSKERLAEFLYSLLKEALEAMPAGGKITVASEVRPAQWWELNEKVKAWLRIDIEGVPGTASEPRAEKEPASGGRVDGAEWILASHGGRFEERSAPGAAAPRYVLSLPICGYPKTAASAEV